MTDAIKAYLKDVSKVERLTPEEELRLARRAKRGDLKARDRIIHANLPLVINMAKKYIYLGIPLADLIEEGNIGLMHAIKKYNPNKGYRFSTYAVWWVRQYITRAIANQARVVRLPVYINEMISKLHKVNEKLSHKFGRKPTYKEIAKEMGIPVKKVKEIEELSSRSSSLDRSVIEESSTEFIDLLEDITAKEAVDELTTLFHREKVIELLNKLPERERKILNMRFGFDKGETHSLSEVAEKFSISRERVRQIEENALKRLRKLLSQAGELRRKVEYKNKKRLRGKYGKGKS